MAIKTEMYNATMKQEMHSTFLLENNMERNHLWDM
jgi:hypothetical protein